MSYAVGKLPRFESAVAVLFVGLLGCGPATEQHASANSAAGHGSAGRAGHSAGAGGKSAGASGAEADAPAGTFTHLYAHVFTPCKLEMCHGGGLIGIDMSSRAGAYASLVNHASNPTAVCAKLGKKRVEPGDPDNSLLYLKLDVGTPCGQQMPPGGQLPDAAREEVRQWIADGAQDN